MSESKATTELIKDYLAQLPPHVAERYTVVLLRAAKKEIEELEKGIKDFLSGDFPHPRAYRSSKTGKCPHGAMYYEDCSGCDTEYFLKVLSNSDTTDGK